MRNTRWLGLAIVAAAAVILTLVASNATPSAAAHGNQRGKHKINWSPGRVVAVTPRGETVKTTVTFSSTVDLTNVTFRFSESLQDTVSVSPDKFDAITANQEYSVEVTFNAPAAGKRRSYNGVMMAADDTRAYAKPLQLRFRIEKTK